MRFESDEDLESEPLDEDLESEPPDEDLESELPDEPESDDEDDFDSEEPSLLWPSELSRFRLRVP